MKKYLAPAITTASLALALALTGCASSPSSHHSSTPTHSSAAVAAASPSSPTPSDTPSLNQDAVDHAQMLLLATDALNAGYSPQDLINKLVDEEYSVADATAAVNSIKNTTDWNAQAAIQATGDARAGFAGQDLINLLTKHGFTQAQAEYGATQAGAN